MSSFASALALLDRTPADALTDCPVLVGLDGFIDTIRHVVAERQTVGEYTRMTERRAFVARITGSGASSTNFELVTRLIKLGGNGPIMADALAGFGVPVTYLGSLGAPAVNPIFRDFAARCERVISVAEPARTDAIEFADGKLMFGQNEALNDVNWENIQRHVTVDDLRAIFARSALVALVNWTMVLHTGDILRAIGREIVPTLPARAPGAAKRWLFFDLADPAKRTRDDLAGMLTLVGQFQQHFRVVLGLNQREARQVGALLGLTEPGEKPGNVAEEAAQLRERLQVETVVIHTAKFAVAADAAGPTYVAGPYTDEPLISTGAGDHFNAGFWLGRLLGGSLEESVALGVGTSGFYVRRATSPGWAELRAFVEELNRVKAPSA